MIFHPRVSASRIRVGLGRSRQGHPPDGDVQSLAVTEPRSPADTADTADTAESSDWWRTSVTYQMYIRSFADADGDGLGDVEGMRSRLPYLADLGVDAVWINPWYPSPQADGGYDVADYRDVEPAFGTLDEGQRFIDDAHAHGIRVILDIVPNHTSDQHAWFVDALAARPGSRERARYIFRPGCGEDGDLPPNDWEATFGGPAWERIKEADGTPGEWYLHLFAVEQPDLNWDNREVRDEFLDILRFWFERGVDGFRIDVAHGLVKDPALPDLDLPEDHAQVVADRLNHPFWDRPGVHDVYREWREVADSFDPPRIFVAEAWVATAERLAAYLRSDELHTAFDFDMVRAPWRGGCARLDRDDVTRVDGDGWRAGDVGAQQPRHPPSRQPLRTRPTTARRGRRRRLLRSGRHARCATRPAARQGSDPVRARPARRGVPVPG